MLQSAEKALKAVIYTRNADSAFLKSHSLPMLASAVGDTELASLANQMEARLGPHTRMRYPDVTRFPSIPSDNFDTEDAGWACDVAALVIKLVRDLL